MSENKRKHYHVGVRPTGEAYLICHEHRHFGPPHKHGDDVEPIATSESLYDEGTARDAVEIYMGRFKHE